MGGVGPAFEPSGGSGFQAAGARAAEGDGSCEAASVDVDYRDPRRERWELGAASRCGDL